MKDFFNFKTSIENEKKQASQNSVQFSNPLSARTDLNSEDLALTDYTQTVARPKFDKDIATVVEVVRILNNLAPQRMPVYNFNIDEINGEYFYKPDGTLLLVREYDGDIIRDYYAPKVQEINKPSVERILEHDKTTGRLRAKIEPITREGSRINTNITIFDEKINNKYTLMQLSEGGVVNNITEFTGKGKSFQTLFRNVETLKPARYLEGKDNKEDGFEMIDCIFDANGGVARIKRYTNKKEVNIEYTENLKNITVKTKQ